MGQATPATPAGAADHTNWCTTPPTAAPCTALHVSRRHRWRPPPASRARGDQRHEPVFARRARNANAAMAVGIDLPDYPQDEAAFVHAWGAERMPATRSRRPSCARATRRPRTRWPGSTCSASSSPTAYTPGGATTRHRQLAGDSWRRAVHGRGQVKPCPTSPARLGDLAKRPARLRYRRPARSAARVRAQDQVV